MMLCVRCTRHRHMIIIASCGTTERQKARMICGEGSVNMLLSTVARKHPRLTSKIRRLSLRALPCRLPSIEIMRSKHPIVATLITAGGACCG